MFKFDSEKDVEMLRMLDELRETLNLPSRGQVVEMAVRRLRASTGNKTAGPGNLLDSSRSNSTTAIRDPETGSEAL